MKNFEYVCFKVVSSALFCQNRKNQILKVIFKNVHYGLVIIVRFCHRCIIHDGKTVICYFMPRHETSKFLYIF